MSISWRTMLGSLALWIALTAPGFGGDARDRIVKKDGSTITGEVMGFENGSYTVRVGDRFVHIPAQEVRTIEQPRAVPKRVQPRSPFVDALGVQEVLESLSTRKPGDVGPVTISGYHDAVAAVLRGDWDFALKLTKRLHTEAPGWASPQILEGVIRVEQGDVTGATKVGLRLERGFPEDVLALRVAAEIYRRAGFSHRYVKTIESVVRRVSSEERLQYELTRLWWTIDTTRAMQYWSLYKENDPALRRPWCREGEALREAQLALTVEDWFAAQVALDTLLARYPWMTDDTRQLRVDILASRLRASEFNGLLEEAMLSVETLAELDASRNEEWFERLASLRKFAVRTAMSEETVEELDAWCASNAHLLGGNDKPWLGQLSGHFQTLGLRAIAKDGFVEARTAFERAQRYSATARPEHFEDHLSMVFERIAANLEVGRKSEAYRAIDLLHFAYPERGGQLLANLNDTIRNELADKPMRLATALEEVRNIFAKEGIIASVDRPKPVGVTPSGTGSTTSDPLQGGRDPQVSSMGEDDPGPDLAELERRRLGEVALEAFRRYYPLEVGTRWVYRRGDGTTETRRLVSVTPHEEDGFKIRFVVVEEGTAGGYDLFVYIRGGDLISMYPTVPPGEFTLRYPFSDQQKWRWKNNNLHYTRKIRRPTEPLHLAIGTFRDYFVVEAENRIVPEDGGGAFSAYSKFTYVAGVGLARITSDDMTTSSGVDKIGALEVRMYFNILGLRISIMCIKRVYSVSYL